MYVVAVLFPMMGWLNSKVILEHLQRYWTKSRKWGSFLLERIRLPLKRPPEECGAEVINMTN